MECVTTFADFKKIVGEPVAHKVSGEVFPYSFTPPALREVVEQARHHPSVKIATGQRGDDLKTSLELAGEEFKTLPLEEAIRTPIHLTIYELGKMREPGGALAHVAETIYWPLTNLWKQNGLRWDKVYPILFLSGPGCSTNYHWDPSSVLIVQLYGQKKFHSLKNPRKWCPEEIAAQGHDAMVRPKDLPDEDILTSELRPGDAIWSPCRAPHWVDADDETAFTMSIAFRNITGDNSEELEMQIA